jgi:hypothetical protein
MRPACTDYSPTVRSCPTKFVPKRVELYSGELSFCKLTLMPSDSHRRLHLTGITCIRDRHSTMREFENVLGCSQSGPSSRLPDLPTGFAACRTSITHDVLELIRKMLYLQQLASQDVLLTENIQTNLEARLIYEEQGCKAAGLPSECCHVALYMIVCLDHPVSWRNAHFPLRLAQRLLHQLKDSVESGIWLHRRDLFLWLLFVGASTSTGECCLAVELSGQYQELMNAVTDSLCSWEDMENLPKMLNDATENFVYASRWSQEESKHRIAGWHDLEKALRSDREQGRKEQAQSTRPTRYKNNQTQPRAMSL